MEQKSNTTAGPDNYMGIPPDVTGSGMNLA